MSSLDDARKRLGELFITGFSGLELSDDTSAFISQAGIGGIILAPPNYENPGQLAELTNQIQECRSDLPLWIAVEQEGGRSQTIRKPFTKIPDAQKIAELDSPKVAFDAAEIIAKELKAAGINLNLAPVADIATNPKNPTLGARCFGHTEDRVTKTATAMVRGHLVAGVQPCVKHFPGMGDTATDPHTALPKSDTPAEILRERELRSFSRAFRSRCSLVMTGHVVMQNLDPDHPATFSKKILQELLRGEMRFSGLIVSDNLELKAVADYTSPDEAPLLALEAGCDILLYRTEHAARHAYATVLKALADGRVSPERILESADRARKLKREALMPYSPIPVAEIGKKIGLPESQELMQKIEEGSKG